MRRSLARRFPDVALAERLRAVPRHADLVSGPLSIRWNDQHVPFVDARSDRDAAVGLGIVHGHLRLAQMEIMRRAAYGRIAEVTGSAAVELDRLLRLVDFPRATSASLAAMPGVTRAWVDGFAEGISAAAMQRPRPPEFEVLGIEPEPWTAEHLFAVSRLCSADYAWKVWRTLNKLRQEEDWASLWADLVGVSAVADEDLPIGAETLEDATPTAFTRAGSNAYAIAGSRTKSGAPLFACDPHHLVTSPSLWLIAGFRTPDITVWGFMIPALPIFGVGRNVYGAWGGTNLHATSSELVDVGDEELTSERVDVPVRAGKTKTVKLRQSRFGPVISDAKPFNMPRETVALHWLGHRPSDEFTPFYELMRSTCWREFEDAVDQYALPGLNLLWADRDGTIGKMIGAHVPRRPLETPPDIVITPSEAHEQWQNLVTGRDLPQTVNPKSGYIASANEAPEDSPVTISLFFSAPHRFERIGELIGANPKLAADDIRTFHRDVFLAPAKALASHLVETATANAMSGPLVDALRDWDGRYAEDSRGALAFELIAPPLIEGLEARSPKKPVSPYWRPFARLTRLVEGSAPKDLAEVLADALEAANAPFERHRTWGDVHRVRLAHPFAKLPWLTSRLPTIDFPTGGSNDTLMKSMHPFTQDVHATNFAANARFIADLADPDETYAVLLGGQDGWPGSRTMFDQVGQWRRGDYIRLPMGPEAVREAFPHESVVEPINA